MTHYFVRIGSLGEIVVASALAPLDRGRRVVVRSPRGIEIAEVTAVCQTSPDCWYRVLRPTSDSDERLARRLERYKREAIEACRKRMSDAGCSATLLEVDQLLDGGTVKLHFLGELDSVAQQIADEVAGEYESIVKTHHLSELLQEGCGPECGSGGGCGSGSACAGCGTR